MVPWYVFVKDEFPTPAGRFFRARCRARSAARSARHGGPVQGGFPGQAGLPGNAFTGAGASQNSNAPSASDTRFVSRYRVPFDMSSHSLGRFSRPFGLHFPMLMFSSRLRTVWLLSKRLLAELGVQIGRRGTARPRAGIRPPVRCARLRHCVA